MSVLLANVTTGWLALALPEIAIANQSQPNSRLKKQLHCETTPSASHARRLARLHWAAAARKIAARLHRRTPSDASQLATTQSVPPGIQQAHLAWNKTALFRAPVFTSLLWKEVHHCYYYCSTKGVSFGVPQACSASLTDCAIQKTINICYRVHGCCFKYRHPTLCWTQSVVSCETVTSWWEYEHGSRIHCHQAMTGESTAGWEDLVCPIVICEV
jgi:hypothetical protein